MPCSEGKPVQARLVWLARCLGSAAILVPTPAPGQAPPPARVLEVRANVVRIETAAQSGFGFLVGLHPGGRVVIATPKHVVQDPTSGLGLTLDPELCFFDEALPCIPGEVVYQDDPLTDRPPLDLAFVSAPYPDGWVWRPDVEAAETTPGEAVWYIGRGGEWYVETRPGKVITGAPPDMVAYSDLDVVPGTSGSPVITGNGIVAMHVGRKDTEAPWGIGIPAIRRVVEGTLGSHWVLTEPTMCDPDSGAGRTLAERRIDVHFALSRVGQALTTMARMTCLGASVRPLPAWSEERPVAEGITYNSGDARLARALQGALATIVRFELVLGTTEADAELGIY